MSTQHLSEQEQLRREKLAELIMMGIDPYPAPLYPVNSNSVYINLVVNVATLYHRTLNTHYKDTTHGNYSHDQRSNHHLS